MEQIVSSIENFLPKQYEENGRLPINHNYLKEQFLDHDEILGKIKAVVVQGDFTLGLEVDRLEAEFALRNNVRHAVSVGSGTDALFLSLKALGIGQGDEVITTPFTFFATVGAIVTAGATPVFIDTRADYNIDPHAIEAKISKKTKAIMPVHWSGRPCDMDVIESIGRESGLPIVSDACHAIDAKYKGRTSGELGTVACFSFHPLKNLNIWGDGGIVTTNSLDIANRLRLLRNHGLINRNTCDIFAYNSRLDTIQAVVARHMLAKIARITSGRRDNAAFFNGELARIPWITVPTSTDEMSEVYHIYSVLCENRDELKKYLISNGIDAKVHYPVPMHLQPAAKYLGYRSGDFPVAESISKRTLSLPVHEFITRDQQKYVVQTIRDFYDFKV